METPRLSMAVVVGLICFVGLCNAIESPQYTVSHTESEFEIRFYRESTRMSAPVREISFKKATRNGFHRCNSYIIYAHWNLLCLLLLFLAGS